MTVSATPARQLANIFEGVLEKVETEQFRNAAHVWELEESPILQVLGHFARYIIRLRNRIEELERNPRKYVK